jgi:transcriptional regulator with XRE-family HTH domain
MKNTFHLLRTHRKQHRLSQSDVAFLLNLKNNSQISRSENGDRSPTIDIILAYHLLFDTQLGDFFMQRRNTIKSRMLSRITPLRKEIQKETPTAKVNSRLKFLDEALIRLNQNTS